jgi:TRAP transporter TAXI family solute receptor
MPRRSIRETLVSVRELLVTAGPFIALTLALLIGAYFVLKPTPPKRIVLATGSEQGAYAAFGKRYQEELKRYGIQVELRNTAGSRENLRLLRDGKNDVDIAFVQGGASESTRPRDEDKEDESLPLMSLGSVFYEPLWIFYRSASAKKSRDGTLQEFSDFKGMRVNTGPRGSGIPGITNRLLQANLMERDDIKRSDLESSAAVLALLNGSIDAMILVSAPEAPLVQMLLQTPGIRLFEFSQAEAYARRYKFLKTVSLARGVVDLSRNVPPRDVQMVAATCSLVAREDLHPALVQLFVQAATRIHGSGGWISKAGQFPTQENSEFPIARDAERFYRNGPPLLQRYLPFWLANLVDRMWVALLSIMVVLLPLGRILPPLYTFRIRRRVFRWYRDLRQIEDELARGNADRKALMERLNKLDSRAEHIMVPLAYTEELYALRGAIHMVRKRLRMEEAAAPPP